MVEDHDLDELLRWEDMLTSVDPRTRELNFLLRIRIDVVYGCSSPNLPKRG